MNDDTNKNILRARLLAFREKRTFTQKAAAKLFGCTQQMVDAMERGTRRPGPHLAKRMAEESGGFLSLYDLRPDVFGSSATAA